MHVFSIELKVRLNLHFQLNYCLDLCPQLLVKFPKQPHGFSSIKRHHHDKGKQANCNQAF